MTADLDVPDVAEPLLGFRVWRVHEPTLSLFSVIRGRLPQNRMARVRLMLTVPDSWEPADNGEPQPMVATCWANKSPDHLAPDPKCHCGIYAATEIEVIAGYLREAPVLGLVQGFGTVIPGDQGWRAERVKIACLLRIGYDGLGLPTTNELLDELGARYGIPVVDPHSERVDDYRLGVRSGFRPGWQHDFEA